MTEKIDLLETLQHLFEWSNYNVQSLLVAAFVAGLLHHLSKKKKSKFSYPPGPKGRPIVKNMFDLPDLSKGETFDTQNLKQAKEFGLVYTVEIPIIIGKLIVISDPDLAKLVFCTKNYPKSFFYKMLEPLLGPNSLAIMPTGPEWAGMRKAFNPGFAPDFLKSMVVTMANKLERFIHAIDKDIQNNQETNMLARSQTFTSDVIVTIAFGEDWGGSKPHPARILEDEICKLAGELIMNPLRRMFDLKAKWRMRQVGIELDKEMLSILNRRLEAGDQGDNSKDICSIAISHLMKNGGNLSEKDKASIVDQLKTFYFAGHDTTATTIAWAIWELSQHPEALAKVRSELKEHRVWTDADIPPTYEQLQKCQYLEGVVKETLRLYPPASGMTRQPSPDNEISYKGYSIGGAVLMVNAYVMHRHPDLWNHPEDFLPERFFDGSEDNLHAKFWPFSRGPRDCIGKYFALLEAKLAISALATRYDFDCVDPNDHIFAMLTNIPKNGAKVKFRSRAS